MDPNGNTKSGPEQSQIDTAELDLMQQESTRTCKICGGPNHHGCGCEAKQRRSVGMVEDKDLKPAGQPESETPTPDEQHQAMVDQLAKNPIDLALKDIRTIADGFEGLCAALYDTNNYLKVIAGDCITIRKILNEEDGKVRNATLISYLSNIEQQLKEINARGQNAEQNKN